MRAPADTESGFSLIELMIALVVTLMVTGAVFGLLSGGQSAFRREPDMTDRQQNVRLAMDVINRDIASAGIGLPPFIQAFTPGLDERGPAAPGGGNADEIAMLANTSSVEPELLCGYAGSASHIRATRNNTLVPNEAVSLVFLANGGWTIKYVEVTHNNHGAAGSCDAHTNHDDYMMNAGHNDPTGLNMPGGICEEGSVGYGLDPHNCNPLYIGAGEFVSYRINPGADGVPNLERRSSGSASTALAWGSTANWSVVARGIENMQVQYWKQSVPTPFDDAPVVEANDYSSLITKVKVTLTARGTARKVAGGTAASGGPTAIRGQMTAETAIRAALQWINYPSPAPSGSPSPLWN